MAAAARIPRPRARGESHAGRGHAPPHAQRRGCGHGREPGLTSAQAAALWGGRPVCREWPDAAAPDPGVTAEPLAPQSGPRSPRRERRSRRCPSLPCPLGTLRRPSPLSCLSSPRSAEIRVVWHGPPATAGQRGPTAGVSRVTRLGRGPQGRAPLRGWGRCWQWGGAGEACAALCRAPSRWASPGAHGVPVQHQLGELLPLFLDVGDLHLGGRERQGGEPRGAGAARSRAPCLLRLFFSQAKLTPSVYSPYFQKAAPAGGAQGGREARTSAMLHRGSTTSLSTKTSCCDSSRASWFSASPHVSSIFLQTTGTRSPVRPPRTRGARSAECRAAADGDATRPGPPARGAPDPLSPQQGLLQLSRRLLQVLGERGQGQLFLEGRGRGAFHHHRPSCLDRRDAGAVSVPRLPGARGDSDVGTQHQRTQQVSAAAALRLPGRYRQLVECTPAQLWGQQTDRHLADGRGRETQDGAQFQKLLLELHSQIGS